MKRALQLLLALIGLGSGCSKSGVISPAQFTRDFAAALREKNPGLKVESVRDLELKVTTPDGKESTCFLDNAYGLYKQDVASKDVVIGKYVTSAVETIAKMGSDSVERTRIVPLIKDRPWLQEIKQSLAGRGGKMADNVFDDYNEDLVIVYAEDTPKNIRYLTPGDLKGLQIERSELRNLACVNLKKLLPPLRLDEGDGYYQVSAGGDYDASLLLLDDVWDQVKKSIHGDVVIAVPSRNGLLAAGSDDKNGIANIKRIAQKVYASDPYHLTPKLYILRGTNFEDFKP
jgi:uncharacterized protein YtpQ (UPF0354 family)